VSDNASTDETPEVLSQFEDPRLRVIRQKTNIGLDPNWNACLTEAKGDYIVFVSDDDTVAPWLLERCIALVRCKREIKIVIALCDSYLTSDRCTLPAIASRELRTGIWDGYEILREYLRLRITTQMCTIMLETNTFRANGAMPTDLPHVGDMVAFATLLLTGKAGLVNESCGTYYIHDASETSKFSIEDFHKDFRAALNRLTRTAENSINDSQTRRRIKFELKRYFTIRAIDQVNYGCWMGAKLSDVMPLIWKWLWDLITIADPDITYRLLKALMIPRLPQVVIRSAKALIWSANRTIQ
jgi:glycosyltransferase involved in cell wall biosynthesis